VVLVTTELKPLIVTVTKGFKICPKFRDVIMDDTEGTLQMGACFNDLNSITG
jgi:hypothetical protein